MGSRFTFNCGCGFSHWNMRDAEAHAEERGHTLHGSYLIEPTSRDNIPAKPPKKKEGEEALDGFI